MTTQSKFLNITELADELGVTPAIVRSWHTYLNLTVPGQGEVPTYDSHWQHIFREIAELRKNGISFNEIAEKIAPLLAGETDEIAPPNGGGGLDENTIAALLGDPLDSPNPDESVLPTTLVEPSPEKRAEPPAPSAGSPFKRPTPAAIAVDTPEPSEIRAFMPPVLSSQDQSKVIRSDLTEKDLLGMYGPPGGPDPLTSSQPKRDISMNLPESASRTAFESMIEDRKQLPVIQLPAEPVSQEIQAIQDNMREAVSQQDVAKMVESYSRLVESYQALASRYSESTFRIGQIDEQKNQLEQKVQELQKTEGEKMEHLKAHIGSLKNMLESEESRFEKLEEDMVSKTRMEQVEKHLKLLTVTLLKQQNEPAPRGFFARLKGLFGG